jgi:hypothetical protein
MSPLFSRSHTTGQQESERGQLTDTCNKARDEAIVRPNSPVTSTTPSIASPPSVTGRRLFLKEAFLAGAALYLIPDGGNAVAAPNTAQNRGPKLKMAKLLDGSGVIGLPPGWKINNSHAGTCNCTGPNGVGVAMGMPWPILRPDAGTDIIPGMAPMPKAEVGDLAGALRAVIEDRNGRVLNIRSLPAQKSGGKPAANFLYQYVQDGKTMVGMGYFTMLDYYDGLPTWNLYGSLVVAPKERFVQELPTLMAVYDSWSPDGKVPKTPQSREMADATAAALRRQGAQTIKSRQETFDRMLQKWKEVQ